MRGVREGAFGIAVAEGAVAGEIAAQAVVQHRRVGVERGNRIGDRRQRFVIDLDQIERVFGLIAAGRDDDGHRLADVAHAIDRDRPAFDRRAHADHQARGMRHDVGAGNDGGNARRRRCGAGPNGGNVRVRMR